MSKQSEAKKAQGYSPKPHTCSTCKSFSSTVKATEWGYEKETCMRCGIGGFAVKKMGICGMHKSKD